MNDKRPPYTDEHDRANTAFWSLTREQRLQRMREAGILGEDWPHLGDKVRVLHPAFGWSYGILVGQKAEGQIAVVCDSRDGVILSELSHFAGGEAVEMVQRAEEGHEQEVAAHALALIGQRTDLSTFETTDTNDITQETWNALLSSKGLVVTSVALDRDALWDPDIGRYRDARARLAG